MGGAGGSVQFLILLVFFIRFCDGESSIHGRMHCNEMERTALIDFWHGLKDPSNRLSSWGQGEDCCRWEGVGCDNRTGHVERLDLRNPIFVETDGLPPDIMSIRKTGLSGMISPSLLNLEHLCYLDLSWNHFGGIHIPRFMGSFKELRYLNLSRTGFDGVVPHELGNLSTLRHLDLSYFDETSTLEVDDVQWLSRLTSLKRLCMDFVPLVGKASNNWVQALNKLPSLVEISLSNCGELSLPLTLACTNFTSISFLDLSFNNIDSIIPDWLFNLTSLVHLDLSFNIFQGSVPATLGSLKALEFLQLSGNNLVRLPEHLSGRISSLQVLLLQTNRLTGYLPDWLGELPDLRELDISYNSIYGPIPESIGRLRYLQTLNLIYNQLNGSVPESLGQLSNLTGLYLQGNNLEGVLTEAHFANLKRLKYFDISNNSFVILNVSSDWNPPPRLEKIRMSSCQLGPHFPVWLRKLENYIDVDFSNAGISDFLPDWFWNSSSRVEHVDLSNNNISGMMQYLTSEAPYLWMDLSNNSLSGSIPPGIAEIMPNLGFLSLAMNRINGSIPFSLCKAETLEILDLSNNFLSGLVPNCWNYSASSLLYLDFSKNNLSGGIPSSICSASLQVLRLNNNNLTEELPSSLKKCIAMVVLDLAHNKLEGSIPIWLGESLQSLRFLLLGSNMLSGNIPPQLSRLGKLQVLDLSNNNLSGVIPPSFGNFTAMMVIIDTVGEILALYPSRNYQNYLMSLKGREVTYSSNPLSRVQSIDISNNGLSGSIPEEIGNLIALFSLNLSRNDLGGGIPEKIGELRQLESLDLSRNQLSGEIPVSLSDLYFLSSLDLSYNNLSGEIPTGHQLETLDDPSIYAGNDDLCGSPLSNKCQEDGKPTEGGGNLDVEGIEGDDMVWLYDGLSAGFVTGFWVVCGTLLLKRTCRIAYFLYIDKMYDWLSVAIALNKARLKRRMIRGTVEEMA